MAWRAPFISPGRLETEFSFNYPDLILTLAGLFSDQLQSIISMDPRGRSLSPHPDVSPSSGNYLENKRQLSKGDVFSGLLCIFSVSMQILLLVKVRCIRNFSLGKYCKAQSLSWLLQNLLQRTGLTAEAGDETAIISIQLSRNDRRMAVIALLFSKPIICVHIPDTARLGWTRDVTVIYHRQKPPELLIDLSQLHHNKGLSCYCFKYKITSQQSSHKSFIPWSPLKLNDKCDNSNTCSVLQKLEEFYKLTNTIYYSIYNMVKK